jgi:hypothetical protein
VTGINARVSGVPSFPGARLNDPRTHGDLTSGLHWILNQFDESRHAATAKLWSGSYPHSGAVIYRLDDRYGDDKLVAVIGDSGLADSVRDLFPCRGWQLRQAAVPGIPLESLRATLTSRIYNALAREGFTTVEEIAVVPDDGLLDIRPLGIGSVDLIRDAIAVATNSHVPDIDPPATASLTAGQLRELTALLSKLVTYANARGRDDIARRAQALLGDLGLGPG